MLDYRDPIWATFDIQPVLHELLEVGSRYPSVTPEPPDDVEIDIPIIFRPPARPLAPGIIDPNVALAIMDVEAGGVAMSIFGKPTIRFEAHIFRGQLDNDAAFEQAFQVADERPWEAQQWMRDATGDWAPIHTGEQRTEYRALELARQIDAEAAYESISMGIAQIMGFNHARVGYPSAQAMYDDFARSEAAQIVGFVNYVLSDADLLGAIKRKDWREIAARYNGSGSVDIYAPRLEAAYAERVA